MIKIKEEVKSPTLAVNSLHQLAPKPFSAYQRVRDE